MKLKSGITPAITTSIAAMTMALLGACSDEPTPPTSESNEDETLEEVRFCTRSLTNSRYTDDGFQINDRIYLLHMPGEGATFNPYDYATYTYNGSVFEPTNSANKIIKKRSDMMTYVAYTNYYSRQSDKLVFSGGKDYLFTVEETADMEVNLLFMHLPARLSLDILNVPASKSVSSVKLLNVYKTYYLECESPYYYDADESSSNRSDVNMTRTSTNKYEYYIPPVQVVGANDRFIEIKLSNGTIYYFGPPEKYEFDSNTLYLWEADLATATPNNVKSRSDENAVNRAKNLKINKINSAKVPFIKKMDTEAQP